ncbi:DUF2063 domain-containing protein [Pseudoalteromonas sp. Scap03]|uniref:HvfC/BufC N-terminal domain-containing protein n=1 Tax=unclassified Pseudoalteromonas TaxID=194690 RepID=UPI0015B8CDB6|nr:MULTISPECIES: DNA-binding domain-containing protein [unclassified Pseudoalteromonas]NWL15393.1 DUF2063 domain-containing protein [Pseudoalteromonas sp. Scap03]QLE80543.1 DUF2063 domain-containing protein [Pseudoalteromonas sp. Scap25]QLE88486.1 DUF2063 domain-containing protein [Pseudoalteromonas sp. Scap06]
MKTPDLIQTQQWLSTVLMVRGDLPQKLNTAASQGLTLYKCVKSSGTLNAMRRVDIYAAGYVMRLVECLRGEFALLCQFMGKEVFDTFAKAFIVTLPSESWTMHQLGSRFADFLAHTKPTGDFSPHQQAMFCLPAELAKFERAKALTLLKPGPETAHEALSISEIELLCGIAQDFIIAVPESVQLIQSDYPLLPLVAELEQGKSSLAPTPEQTYIAISRHQYRLKVTMLNDWQTDFLLQLKKDQHCYKEAVAYCSDKMNIETQVLKSQLAIWIPSAVNIGLFTLHKN